MTVSHSGEKDFITQITEIIEENISNEQFGVSELADEIGMSRSNLLRKVKKLSNLSVSQFIRNIRLQHAREMLQNNSLTISEVSYKVGFGSPSYFIKCFRELYGYSPGDSSKKNLPEPKVLNPGKKKIPVSLITVFLFIITAFVLVVFIKPWESDKKEKVKSIAVLPFINDSNDSTNVYIINGLMESTLNNLQQIKDLRVISRTSVEKYRKKLFTTPEIAKELNANYLIEGSGQKIGDQILLSIQLIEAATDDHLWSRQYERNARDIFNLQTEIAKDIAKQVQAIITPEEEERIEKVPTDNLVAYDYFLKGLDLLNNPVSDNVEKSIPFFHKALQHDSKFARAYAAIAIAYYFVDEPKIEKQFSDSINYYADKALLHDSQLPQSLIAKALFYMSHREFELAVPYFEKTLELNPNNDLVFIFLVDLYVHHLPNTEKYLEYALKGLEVDVVAAYDSATASYSFLHISNAFIQAGFVDEAEKYINKSLEYLEDNLYSQYTRAFILFAKNRDLKELNETLLEVFEKDKTRLDVMQEVAKSYYYLRDYENSFKYYKSFAEIRNTYQLGMYRSENYKLGFVYEQVGELEKGKLFFEDYKFFTEQNQSIYKHYNLAMYYSHHGEKEKAIEHLRDFSKESNYHYWIVLFTKMEPIMDNIKDMPEFKKIMSEIENNFENWHKKIRSSLEEKDLI